MGSPGRGAPIAVSESNRSARGRRGSSAIDCEREAGRHIELAHLPPAWRRGRARPGARHPLRLHRSEVD